MAGGAGEGMTRVTFDLDLDVHRALRLWTVEHDVKQTDVWRALLGRLLSDPEVEAKLVGDLEGRRIARHRPGRPKGRSG